MADLEVGSRVGLIGGAFAGFEGEVVAIEGDALRVEVSVFGRKTALVVKPEELSPLSSGPVDARQILRGEIEADAEKLLNTRLREFWSLESRSTPREPLEAWRAYEAFAVETRAASARELAARVAKFDAEYPSALEYSPELRARFDAELDRWRPYEAMRKRERDARDALPPAEQQAREEQFRKEAARAHAIRRRAERAPGRAQFLAWRAGILGDESSIRARREEARREVANAIAPVREHVLATHGLRLPDHFFTFWAFYRSLQAPEREALEYIGFTPSGPFALLEHGLGRPLAQGADERMHRRYYLDPPEMLSVIHGHTDGLHWGLWYDDPREPAVGVASYYAKDDPTISLEAGTLLEALRRELEKGQASVDASADKNEEYARNINLLREALMAFETAERDEVGQEYLELLPRPSLPDRIPTIDGAGIVLPAGVPGPEPRPALQDAGEFFDAVKRGDPALTGLVRDALSACAGGSPGSALILGRDLKQAAQPDDAKACEQARDLLVAAYTALGRTAHARMAELWFERRERFGEAVYPL